MPNDFDSYKNILNRLIAKQISLLGIDLALAAAKKIPGIIVGPDGKVVSIQADEKTAAKLVTEAYISLSGQNIGTI